MSINDKIIKFSKKSSRLISRMVLGGETISQKLVQNIIPKQPVNKNELYINFIKNQNPKPYKVNTENSI